MTKKKKVAEGTAPSGLRIYRGFAPIDDQLVYATGAFSMGVGLDDSKAPTKRDLLKHHVLHSKAGFAWGYNGDAPLELARCILWDHLGAEPHALLYQKFKVDYVSKWSPAR